MLFTEYSLDERLQRALATAGFVKPTPIQAAAMPVAMAGRDLVGTAQTGTGKTAAFVLPILQQLMGTPLEHRKTRAVILAPTRELVEQIIAVVRELGVHTNVRAIAVYGGVPMHQQTRALRNGVELVVACPGRLLDHINRRNADLRQLDYLVLDEADRMLDMGFLPSIQEIIDNLPVKRQTALFSATFPKTLNNFVKQTLSDPVRVEVDTAVPAQTVRHTLYQVKSSMKPTLLTSLLRQLIPDSDSVLIFTQTRAGANQVAGHLHAAGMHADVLHAEKTQRERQDTLNRFRAGVFPYLVATDIAARGIDVTSISHVINFDVPGKADDYLHRIGRTGRMERTGHAISLMTRGDIRAVREIERMLGKKIEVAQLDDREQQMHDAIPMPVEAVARPAHRQEIARATYRSARPPYQGEENPRRATPINAAPRADRPARPRRDDAPPSRNERPRRFDESDSAPARAERPAYTRRDDAPPPSRNDRPRRFSEPDTSYTRTERPARPRRDDAPPSRNERPRRFAESDTAPTRTERPAYTRRDDAPPSRNERPRRFAEPDAAPARNERPGKRRADGAPPRGDRPQRRHDVDVPPARNERPARQFSSERPPERPARPEHAGRNRRPLRRDSDATNAPQRREHPAENRFAADTTSREPRQERPGGKPFTGMAARAKDHRKSSAGKRRPGEVAYGTRPSGKSRPEQSSAGRPPSRSKRPAGRGR